MHGMLTRLVELLKSKNIFVRNRKQMKTRSLGILLYHYGLSLRKFKILYHLLKKSAMKAFEKWYHCVDIILTVGKIYREIIAVDETKVKINERLHILWAAIDIKTWEVIGVWICQGRSEIKAYSFLKIHTEKI